MHHREENNHHRPDQQQEVRGNFAFIELRRKTRVGLEIFTREGGNFRDTPPEGTDIIRWIENAFREIRVYALYLCESSDYVGLLFESADLARGPAGLSFRPARDFNS